MEEKTTAVENKHSSALSKSMKLIYVYAMEIYWADKEILVNTGLSQYFDLILYLVYTF